MKGYKAYNKGLICIGKQYKENTLFIEKQANICKNGMHFCKEPLDVLSYYPLVSTKGEITEFTEVEALDECKTDDNIKYCTKKLKIGTKIDFAKLVQISVNFDYEKLVDVENNDNNFSALIGSSGDCVKIASSGDYAILNSTGKYNVIMCSGYDSKVKAKKGSWITLAEWKYNIKKRICIPICVKTVKVDGKKIKEDTFYKLKNKKFVEVSE